MEVRDILGQTVLKGDSIAAGFRTGNTADLRVGTVLGFGERGNELTVKVQWHKSSYGSNVTGRGRDVDIVGEIEARLVRFVKIADHHV